MNRFLDLVDWIMGWDQREILVDKSTPLFVRDPNRDLVYVVLSLRSREKFLKGYLRFLVSKESITF